MNVHTKPLFHQASYVDEYNLPIFLHLFQQFRFLFFPLGNNHLDSNPKENNKKTVLGTIDKTKKGSGYLIVEKNEKDFFISEKNIKKALNGDTVECLKITNREVEVVKVIKRKKQRYVGVVFSENNQKFIDYNLNPKRGIILHGDPGCGKTSLIHLLVDELKKYNGLCIYFENPYNWVELAKLVRKVEKTRPLLCVIEDIDLVIDKYGEEVFLNFLDGLNSIENVVYVATTNNLEKIPDRIKDRPSRFDKKYKIEKPNAGDRNIFFNSILNEEDKKLYDLDKLVKDTNNFTMAHLKETFISLYILKNPYDETVKRLKKSKITDEKIGFNISED